MQAWVLTICTSILAPFSRECTREKSSLQLPSTMLTACLHSSYAHQKLIMLVFDVFVKNTSKVILTITNIWLERILSHFLKYVSYELITLLIKKYYSQNGAYFTYPNHEYVNNRTHAENEKYHFLIFKIHKYLIFWSKELSIY